MNTKAFSAYNEASKRSLASGISTVDSIDEPIKVLKILLEGLAPAAGAGIWITRFRGLPVARSYSPFDLIYLNEEFRVVQAVEITQTSKFEPFKGQPTSALILPPGSINSSRTFDGDRIRLRADTKITQPRPERVSPQGAKAVNGAPAAPLATPSRHVRITIEPLEVVAPPAATHPGTVLKPARRPHDVSPPSPLQVAEPVPPPAPPSPPVSVPAQTEPAPADQAAAATPAASRPAAVETPASVPQAPVSEVPAPAAVSEVPTEVAPIATPPVEAPPIDSPLIDATVTIDAPTLNAPVIDAPSIESPPEVQPVAAIEPEETSPPVDAAASVVPPIPLSVREAIQPSGPAEMASSAATESSIPDKVAEAEQDEAVAQDEVPEPGEVAEEEQVASQALSAAPSDNLESDSPDTDLQLQIPESVGQPGQKAMNLARRWDVRLLYAVFPELHPAYRPEFQVPYIDLDPFHTANSDDDDKPSTKAMILSYLYPDLELDTVEKRQRQQRRAPRIPNPGLVGYFFSAGHAEPHKITNFSVMGFYMETEDRWLPGTIIRVTLQMMDSDGSNPGDTLTVHSRVVNWDEHGGGFEFVLPGFID